MNNKLGDIFYRSQAQSSFNRKRSQKVGKVRVLGYDPIDAPAAVASSTADNTLSNAPGNGDVEQSIPPPKIPEVKPMTKLKSTALTTKHPGMRAFQDSMNLAMSAKFTIFTPEV